MSQVDPISNLNPTPDQSENAPEVHVSPRTIVLRLASKKSADSDAAVELQSILSQPLVSESITNSRISPQLRATPGMKGLVRPSGIATPVPLKLGLPGSESSHVPTVTPTYDAKSSGDITHASSRTPAIVGVSAVKPLVHRSSIALSLGGTPPIQTVAELDDDSSDEEYRDVNEVQEFPVPAEELQPRGRLRSFRLPKLGASLTNLHAFLNRERATVLGPDGNMPYVSPDEDTDVPDRPANPGATVMMSDGGDEDFNDEEIVPPPRSSEPGPWIFDSIRDTSTSIGAEMGLFNLTQPTPIIADPDRLARRQKALGTGANISPIPRSQPPIQPTVQDILLSPAAMARPDS